MKMGEDVVETWWKHWETLGKYGEIPASQYRLQTHVQHKYLGIVVPEMQHFTDVHAPSASFQVALVSSKVSVFVRHA